MWRSVAGSARAAISSFPSTTSPRIAVSPKVSMSDTRYGCESARRSGGDASASARSSGPSRKRVSGSRTTSPWCARVRSTSRSVPLDTSSDRASSLIPIARPPSASARRTRAALSTAGTGRSISVLLAIRVRRIIRQPALKLREPMAGGPLDRSETWSDDERRAAQWRRLARALPELLLTNVFYGRKFADSGIRDVRELRSVRELPFTTKAELSRDQTEHPSFGSNLTYPIERYVRLHQTSGTTGRPLRVLDTAESWQWWRDCWRPIYTAAGVTSRDRIFFAFSFGPFVGFWSAFAGAEQLGALCLTGGAMSSVERVAAIIATEATVLMCTPTYALRLGEAARAAGIDIARSALRVSIHAGEPGASIPATRERIEAELGLTSFDHTGATEVGAHGFSCDARDGVHLNESAVIAEIVDPAPGETADEGEGELVMTNLGRWGMPVIRYRTGDRVRGVRGRCACGRTSLKLVGGIAGRVDDMVTVRGVNVFPSAIEAIVRRFAEVEEYRVELVTVREMEELRCTVETRGGTELAERVANAIHRDLGIRCVVAPVAPGTLPRFDMKAKRFVRRREEART